jgi:heat shock protein HslJ
MRATLFMSVALVLSSVGCSLSSESNPWCTKAPLPVENYKWQLEHIQGLPDEAMPCGAEAAYFELHPADCQFTGYTGMNQFNGTYAMTGHLLKFSPAAMTRRAGPEQSTRQETNFNNVLANTAEWRPFGDNEIDLLAPGGYTLARFYRGAGADMK